LVHGYPVSGTIPGFGQMGVSIGPDPDVIPIAGSFIDFPAVPDILI